MRVDNQGSPSNSNQKTGNFKAGSIVRGQIKKSGNKTSLIQSNGKEMQVRINGSYSETDKDFLIIENKKIPLIKSVKNKSKTNKSSNIKNTGNLSSSIKFDQVEKISRILSSLGVSINTDINQKINQIINDEISSAQLYRILLQLMESKNRKYFKIMVNIWQNYFKKKAKVNEKFTDNIAKDHVKESSSFNISKDILNDVLKMISKLDGDLSEKEGFKNPDSSIMNFLFFIMPDTENPDLLPFLMLGNKKKGNIFWVFTEFRLSEIGDIRLAISQNNKRISGCIYCDIGKKDIIKKNMEFDNMKIIEVSNSKESIIDWPFKTVLNFPVEVYDKLA